MGRTGKGTRQVEELDERRDIKRDQADKGLMTL